MPTSIRRRPIRDAGTHTARFAIRDAGGFDTLVGTGWEAVAVEALLYLRSAEPQEIGFADSDKLLTIDFDRGGEVQFANTPAGLGVSGPGYDGSVLTVDSLGSGFDGDLGRGE